MQVSKTDERATPLSLSSSLPRPFFFFFGFFDFDFFSFRFFSFRFPPASSSSLLPFAALASLASLSDCGPDSAFACKGATEVGARQRLHTHREDWGPQREWQREDG